MNITFSFSHFNTVPCLRPLRPSAAGARRALSAVLATLFLSLICLFPAAAMADCSDPTGVEGEQVYNTNYKTMQFCDGTTWYAMKGSAAAEDTLAKLSCATNQIAKWDGVAWVCANESAADLSSLNASNLTSGTVPDARLTGNYNGLGTLTATTFSGAHTGNGSGLTSLNASNLASGTVPDARLSGNYSGLGTVTATTFSGAHTGNGSGLTNLNASNLTSGTVPIARVGTGTKNIATILRGDNSFTSIPDCEGADKALNFDSATGVWSCANIAYTPTCKADMSNIQIGDTCDDGSKFLGTHPYFGWQGFYAADADQSASSNWSNAITLCNNLSYHGHTDWYLPSKNEVSHLFENRSAIGGFTGSGLSYYWSSTDVDASNAYWQNFGNGIQSYTTKSNTYYVRCVRRG